MAVGSRSKRDYQDLDNNQPGCLQRFRTQYFHRNYLLGLASIVIVALTLYIAFPHGKSQQLPSVSGLKLEAEDLEASQQLIVNITQGSLQGKRLKTRDGRDYLAFLGIPYAKPPVQELRFKPPEAAEGWSGIRNATVFGSECLQDGRQGGWRGTKGNEDCLNLNVYTPKKINDLITIDKGTSGLLPVMVYFHGGGLAGNVFYNGGEYLMDEDVILVTLHYRLGVFGALNLHNRDAFGNQGWKDQVMALRWVQSNIHKFGGDSDKVLLFGESSGASSGTAHLVSPMSEGLFSRIISQSGTILAPGMFAQHPIQDAFELGNQLNCSSSTNNPAEITLSELTECLMSVEPEKLVVTTFQAAADGSFMNTVESSIEGNIPFLTDSGLKLFQAGNFKPIPAIIGVNNQEGFASSIAVLKIPQIMDAYNQDWEGQIMAPLHFQTNPNNFTKDPAQIVKEIREFYFHGQNISQENGQNLTDMFSDRELVHSAYKTAEFLMRNNQRALQKKPTINANVYLYYLTEQVTQSFWVDVFSKIINVTSEEVKGAGHVDELQFIFPNAGYNYPEIPVGAPQYNFSKMLVHLWASFADTGIPDTKTTGMEWTPISGTRPFKWYQIVGNESRMMDDLADRMNFWDAFTLTDLYF